MDISRDGITMDISRDGITVDISKDGITVDISRDGITVDISRDEITVRVSDVLGILEIVSKEVTTNEENPAISKVTNSCYQLGSYGHSPKLVSTSLDYL